MPKIGLYQFTFLYKSPSSLNLYLFLHFSIFFMKISEFVQNRISSLCQEADFSGPDFFDQISKFPGQILEFGRKNSRGLNHKPVSWNQVEIIFCTNPEKFMQKDWKCRRRNLLSEIYVKTWIEIWPFLGIFWGFWP